MAALAESSPVSIPVSDRAPGVYRQDVVLPSAPQLVTGCPVVLGYASGGNRLEPFAVSSAAEFAAKFTADSSDGYLAETVQAFFANGGQRAWIVRLDDPPPRVGAFQALADGLAAAASTDADLICAPDIVRQRGLGQGWEPGSVLPPDPEEVTVMQKALIADCERSSTRIAILDALPTPVLASTGVGLGSPLPNPVDAALLWQQSQLDGSADAALYHPWISPAGAAPGRFVPPCGAVAGIIARTDRLRGVYKAPANEPVLGVVDVEDPVNAARQGPLNRAGVNCIRAFPGRGIRVWGARTVSSDSAWTYLNVRRVILTTARWAAQALREVTFEPSSQTLWARVTRLVESYLDSLYQAGALSGATPADAFMVTCDETNNPSAIRELGQLVVDVAVRVAPPNEIVLIRLIRDATGVIVETSSSPG